jgi:hypothetical protein
VPVLVDTAEALGASWRGRPAGAQGDAAVVSFNGNKIVTTSGGGALVTDDANLAARVRHLATQAREPVLHYEHRDVGFNHRLSNLLAAMGRPQLAELPARVERRRAAAARYCDALEHLPGVRLMPDVPTDEAVRGTRASWWLTSLTLDPTEAVLDRDGLIAALAGHGVEARPVWQPMHLQPVYAAAPRLGGDVSARLFATGVTLPYVHETAPHGRPGLGDEVTRLVAGLLAARLVPRGDDYAGASCEQTRGRREPDAAVGPGDQHAAPVAGCREVVPAVESATHRMADAREGTDDARLEGSVDGRGPTVHARLPCVVRTVLPVGR